MEQILCVYTTKSTAEHNPMVYNAQTQRLAFTSSVVSKGDERTAHIIILEWDYL